MRILTPFVVGSPAAEEAVPAGICLADKALVAAPALLHGGWRQPVGPVKLNKDHPFTDGLVGCWPMWQSGGAYVRDLSGYGNHAYGAGSATIAKVANGKYGQGLHVENDATTTNLALGSVPSTHPLNMGTDNEVSVFFFGYCPTSTETGTSSPRLIDIGSSTNATNGWGLALAPATHDLYFMVNGTGYTSPGTYATSGAVHAIGVTATSGDIDFFADGERIGGLANSFIIPTTTTNGRLLNWHTSDRQYRGGPAYFIAVWDRKVDDDVMNSLGIHPYQMFLPV